MIILDKFSAHISGLLKDPEEIQFRHAFPKLQEPCRSIAFDIENNDMFLDISGQKSNTKKRQNRDSRTPRKTRINASFPHGVEMKEVIVPRAGPMQFIGRPFSILQLPYEKLVPSEIELICYYERKEKQKIIHAVYLTNACPALNGNVALARYDHFYACDANTWSFEEIGDVSICVVLRGDLSNVISENRRLSYSQQCVIEITDNATINPELLAAKFLIEMIIERLPSLPNKPIGLIMDSELGKIKDINARRAPLVDDFYLPTGFEIMYASDATGSMEYAPNLFIRMCDNAATDYLKKYQTERNLKRIS